MDNFLRKIYLSRFLDSFILIGVIFTLFFSRAGLDTFQISLLITIWSITTIITEVPFGVFADTYSRKNLLILGLIFRAMAFGFWLMGGFANFAIGFIFWGLKNTLTSGTLEALVYDELVYYKKENLYEEVSGKMGSVFSVGLLLSAIFGGIASQYSFSLVLWLSIATSVLAALILTTLRPVKRVRTTGEIGYYRTLIEAILHIKQNPSLLYIISFICIIFAAFGATDEYWALIFEQLKLNPATIGILVALVYGIGSLAGFTVKFFKNKSKSLGYVLIIVGALIYLALGLFPKTILLPLAFVAIYLFQIASIRLEAQMQHSISSGHRATISSLKSLVFELIYMGYVLLFGIVGAQFGTVSILIASGLIILLGMGTIPLFRPKNLVK